MKYNVTIELKFVVESSSNDKKQVSEDILKTVRRIPLVAVGAETKVVSIVQINDPD